MPKLGDPVLFYTHESNDNLHHVIDFVAIVTKVLNDHELCLCVFPPDERPYPVRVRDWDPKLPVERRVIGTSYWRAPGSKPPDFKAAFEAPDLNAARREQNRLNLEAKQKAELDAANAGNIDAIKARHAAERKDFDKAWDENPATGLPPGQLPGQPVAPGPIPGTYASDQPSADPKMSPVTLTPNPPPPTISNSLPKS